MPATVEDFVDRYVRLRDKKADLKKRHAEELAPLDEAMSRIEGLLMGQLNTVGADSIRTPHGTVYKQSWSSARVADWQQVLDYAIEHERLDLFERRVSKTVVDEIGHVPGVEVDRGVKVNIRRS
jgi:hypothetical protein